MGASNSRARGGGGRLRGRGRDSGGITVEILPPLLQKQQVHSGRPGAPRTSPRSVMPSEHTSGTQNSSLNSENIQEQEGQGQMTVSPNAEPAASKEKMPASTKDGRNLNEEIVTSQTVQAIEAMLVSSHLADESGEGCGFEAPEEDKKPEARGSLLPLMEEEEDDECPICLEAFDEGNPKLATECEHHYHLACILGWMERNATCPICGQVAIFDGTTS